MCGAIKQKISFTSLKEPAIIMCCDRFIDLGVDDLIIGGDALTEYKSSVLKNHRFAQMQQNNLNVAKSVSLCIDCGDGNRILICAAPFCCMFSE